MSAEPKIAALMAAAAALELATGFAGDVHEIVVRPVDRELLGALGSTLGAYCEIEIIRAAGVVTARDRVTVPIATRGHLIVLSDVRRPTESELREVAGPAHVNQPVVRIAVGRQ